MISFLSYDVIRLSITDKIRKLHEYIDLELFLLRFNFLVLVKNKTAFPPLQPNNFIHRESKIRKRQIFNMLEELKLCKTEFNFLCSNDENCNECGEYVRHVFSFVPGSLAAISLLVVLLFHASKTICKESGEIFYYDTFKIIIIIILFFERNVLLCVGHLIRT